MWISSEDVMRPLVVFNCRDLVLENEIPTPGIVRSLAVSDESTVWAVSPTPHAATYLSIWDSETLHPVGKSVFFSLV